MTIKAESAPVHVDVNGQAQAVINTVRLYVDFIRNPAIPADKREQYRATIQRLHEVMLESTRPSLPPAPEPGDDDASEDV